MNNLWSQFTVAIFTFYSFCVRSPLFIAENKKISHNYSGLKTNSNNQNCFITVPRIQLM